MVLIQPLSTSMVIATMTRQHITSKAIEVIKIWEVQEYTSQRQYQERKYQEKVMALEREYLMSSLAERSYE